MNTFNQIRHGLTQAWDLLSEGWYEISQRAGQALTRFQPMTGGEEFETRDQRFMRDGSRWGVLAAEISEDDGNFYVRMEVPGMDPDDFEINIVGDRLIVRGEKRVDTESRRGRYLVMERAYGRFERTIPLPSHIDDEKVEAKYRRGVLDITLQKTTQSRRKKVQVTPDDQQAPVTRQA